MGQFSYLRYGKGTNPPRVLCGSRLEGERLPRKATLLHAPDFHQGLKINARSKKILLYETKLGITRPLLSILALRLVYQSVKKDRVAG